MSYIRWYADNSYIHGIWGAEIENILVFGGIALDKDTERAISSIMENVKRPPTNKKLISQSSGI